MSSVTVIDQSRIGKKGISNALGSISRNRMTDKGNSCK